MTRLYGTTTVICTGPTWSLPSFVIRKREKISGLIKWQSTIIPIMTHCQCSRASSSRPTNIHVRSIMETVAPSSMSWSCAVGFRWRKGDLLVLDNLTVQHGRIGFTGKREILVHLMTDWTSVLTRCFISSLDHEKFPSVLTLNHFLFQL